MIKHNPMLRWAVLCVPLVAATVLLAQAQGEAPYLNPDLPMARRAADLVSRMTLEEKVLQMQSTAPAMARLGVPAYNWWNEALHGVAQGRATVFPQAIGLAATWDTELMHRVADVISTEARAKYNDALTRPAPTGPDAAATLPGRAAGLTYWSPNINIFRDPRWGRGQETYGEDPYLTARMGVAFVTGMQGDDPDYLKVVATPKHYAVHSGPEPQRHVFDAHVSDYDLEHTYLAAFRATVLEGKAGSVMCVYNSVAGVPGCASDDLLQKWLRDYSGLSAKRTATGATVQVTVQNTSQRDGDEVVQLYVGGGGGDEAPIRNLSGFQRVHLRAGERRQVSFTVAADDLPKSTVEITVGGGQPASNVQYVKGTL